MTPDAPLLLTPGPLTTRIETRRAMLRDWGSRDDAFVALTAAIRASLLEIANGEATHVAVPIQGSGTFVVEAAIGTMVGEADKLLVLVNGAYGERMVEIARRLGRIVAAETFPDSRPVDPMAVERALAADPAVTHVALVHCETTTGVLNPLEGVARVVARHGRRLLLDAMSSFGALPIDLASTPVAAVMASANKCLEGAPGVAFALVERGAIEAAAGVSASLSLDLHAQWRRFETDGQWRFTPPVQVVAALAEALRLLGAEGGPPARLARYRNNLAVLVEGMRQRGFRLYLEQAVQAPVIATFVPPAGRPFDFGRFYSGLARRGFLIYPGKLTTAESFRIGCIGALDRSDFERLLKAVDAVIGETATI